MFKLMGKKIIAIVHTFFFCLTDPMKMGSNIRKPCDQVMPKPAYSATDTSKNLEILHVASEKRANIVTDQPAWMHRLICTFVVCMRQNHI